MKQKVPLNNNGPNVEDLSLHSDRIIIGTDEGFA